ncbi:MAG: hypothetical protein WAL29_07980 [Bacteroidales bacterium]
MKRITIPNILILVSLFTAFRLEAMVVTADPTVNLQGSLQDLPLEGIYLHIDRDKYIAGEDIWVSIYTTDQITGKLSSQSVVAYVELLNPWNMPVVQTRFQLSGGRGDGNLLLPDSVSSGTYTIRAYTNRMKNFLPDNCYMHDIEICNPFKGSDFWRKTYSTGSVSKKPDNSTDKTESTKYLAGDTIYSRREKVSVKVKIGDGQPGISEVSISVTPAEVASESRWNNVTVNIGTGLQQYGFESEGHYLSGRIRYRDGTVSDSAHFLYMSIQGKVADFKYAHIDTSGRFSFIMPTDSKMRNLILQPENANNNMILEIEPSFSWLLPASRCFKDTFTDPQLDVFAGLSFNYQAAKIYGTSSKKETVNNDNSNLKKRRFYGIPEMEIFLKDYIRLPVMQEVFFELVPGIILRSGRSGYEIKITNPMTGNFYVEPPLVMIDGVIINDLTILADLDPGMVEKIEVVKTPYLTGDLILHGIVNVITRSGDFSSNNIPEYAVVLPYRVIDIPNTFVAPDYTGEPDSLSRRPDLRNTLYWNPSLKTGRSGEAEIEFWTSDLPGIYIINIQGISGTGELVSLRNSFIVR